MFLLCVLLLCVLEFANSHLLSNVMDTEGFVIIQTEVVLILGAIVFSSGSMRERSVLDIVFIWAVWILATDWVPYFLPIIATIETGIFAVMLGWVWLRSYDYISNPVGYGTVFIAFYGGPKAPFLSRIASHFGFPFSSIAIVANEIGVRPSKAAGEMVEVPPHVLQSKGYVFINTGVAVTHEITVALESIIGTKTGYGIFRFKCLKNLMPVIECLGSDWTPDTWPLFPARYYSKCVKNASKHYLREAA